jgi:uncharacterized sulfatase
MSALPNLLFIILDTTRRDRLMPYQQTRETTPELAAFAQRGTRFERAVAPAQWTIPAHGSLFSGLYPGQHGLHQASLRIRDDAPLLAERLRARGYHTVAFCNNPLVGVINHGLQRGFDAFYNYASAIPHRPYDIRKPWLRREFARRFRPTARKIGNWFAQNDTAFRISLNPLFVPLWSRYINFKGSTADSLQDLVEYWGAHAAGGAAQPLFAFVNLMGAHLPYHPPNDALDRLAPRLRADKRAVDFVRRFNAHGAAWASPPEPPLLDWQQQALLDFYDAELFAQDVLLGKALETLRARGLLDNTTVVIAADHGEAHGEHDLFGHGFDTYQELVHIPFLIAGERFPADYTASAPVSARRIYHTLLHLADAAPAAAEEPLAGDARALSLATAIARARNGQPDHETLAFSEAYAPTTFIHVLEHHNPGVIERMALRETRRAVYADAYKLMTSGDGERLRPLALYDVPRDPAEARNLLQNEPERLALLLGALRAFLHGADTRDPEPAPVHAPDDPAVLEHLRSLGYID